MLRGLRVAAALGAVTLLCAVGLVAAVACGGDGQDVAADQSGDRIITDMAGRSVEVPRQTDRVVAIGPGALRLICYAGAADQVVGVERVESQWGPTGRPYIIAHPELAELPVIGQGGPDSAPDPEALLEAGPDVIFVAYLADGAAADELQSKTGIPVVVLSYGPLGAFDDELLRSVEIVGDITGNAARGAAVVDRVRGWLEDLDGRTRDIPSSARPSVYAGAISMKGTHGIESTQTEFPPFVAINAANVVDTVKTPGSVMIDREQLLEWDSDYIFIDESGYAMVVDDQKKNPDFYRSLKAVKDGHVYGYLPYNFYTTNVDTALADAYFLGSVIYPEAFSDVDPEAKADEIYTFMLGASLYERMKADFGGFTRLDLTR